MTPDRLLAHYDRIADASDAVARLRRFVMDLAVRGKLVAQEPDDEPAAKLQKRLALAVAQAEQAARARSEIDPTAFYEDGEFPISWTLPPLGEVALVGSGIAKGKDNRGKTLIEAPYLRVANVQRGYLVLDVIKTIEVTAAERDKYLLQFGDVLMTEGGDWDKLGRAAVWGAEIADCVHQNHVFRIRVTDTAALLPRWVALAANSPLGRSYFENAAKQTTNLASINMTQLRRFPLPLPPSAEQHRIVAKVDEMMSLCDRLEAGRVAREAARDRLAAASLARLNTQDPDTATFTNHARFALNTLPALSTRADQIKALRQTILNLAVRGQLVPQDPTDEPASELQKRIAIERTELVKKREIRREAPMDPVQPAEIPFDVPTAWSWLRIGDAVLFTQYGTSQKSSPSEKGVPVLTMGNIQDGLVIWSNEKRIPEASEELPSLYLRKYDLLYNRTNSAELVGKTGIYLGEDHVRTFASYLIRLRPSLLSSNPGYLNMAMNAPQFRETQIIPLIKKQTGQANVNGTALKNMLIPLPPLTEQHRIVAKVDALMALCDRLEAAITTGDDTRRRLLDALLQEALASPDTGLDSAA